MSSSLLSAALDDATRVVKKQKTTSSVTAQAIEGALRVLEEAQEKCDEAMTTTATGHNANGILAAAAEALKGADASGVVAAATKDLHGAVGKLGKVKRKRRRERKKGKERASNEGKNNERAATGTERKNPFSPNTSLYFTHESAAARAPRALRRDSRPTSLSHLSP